MSTPKPAQESETKPTNITIAKICKTIGKKFPNKGYRVDTELGANELLSQLSADDLVVLCIALKLDGYASKNKSELVSLVSSRIKKRKTTSDAPETPPTKRAKVATLEESLDDMTIPQLKGLCEKLGISSGTSRYTKPELVKHVLGSKAQKEQLEKHTNPILIELCKTLYIKGYNGKKKDDLIEMIISRPPSTQTALKPQPTTSKPEKPAPKSLQSATAAPLQLKASPSVSSGAAAAAAAASSSSSSTAVTINVVSATPAPSAAVKPLYFPHLVVCWKKHFPNTITECVGKVLRWDMQCRHDARISNFVQQWSAAVRESCNRNGAMSNKTFEYLFALDHSVEYEIMNATEFLYNNLHSLAYETHPASHRELVELLKVWHQARHM